MNTRFATLILPFVPWTFLAAQVIVDKAVVLDGPSRRVHGLESTTAPNAALNAETLQRNTVQVATGLTGNSWVIDLPAFGQSPDNGAQLVLEVPIVTADPVSIVLNGTGPYPVMREGAAVSGAELVPGSWLSVVLANDLFHILNGSQDMRRPCPAGTVVVNDQYCIEPTEHGTGDYFQAGLACAASGLRLCTWAEFVAACDHSIALGMTATTNNWEWTNNTSNEDNSARIVGLNSCISAGNWLSTGSGPVAFRCCFTR